MGAIRRVRPARMTLAALGGFLWAVSFGGVRDFVWADLREGLIDLRGLGRPARAAALLGFGLLFMMVAVLVFNDVGRASSRLVPLTRTIPGRGGLIPVALLPLTLFLLSLAWSYILTGALHSHRLIRIGALLLFLPGAGLWLSTSLTSISFSGLNAGLVAGVFGTLAVIVIFAVRWHGKPQPAAEFMALLGATALLFVTSHARDVADWQTLGAPVMVAKIEATVGLLSGLLLPILLLIGLDIAAFVHQASHWTTEVVTKRLSNRLLLPLLGAFLIWRLATAIREAVTRIQGADMSREFLAYAGAAAVPLLVALAWYGAGFISRRTAQPSAAAIAQEVKRIALPLILLFNAVELVVFALLWLGLGLLPLTGIVGQITTFASALGRQSQLWHVLVGFSAVAGAVVLARRGQRTPATYLAAFGLLQLWFELTTPGRPLAALTWRGPEPVDFWLAITLAGVTVMWALRRELTAERAAALFFGVTVTWLLRQTAFIESPFSPFLGFAGVGFVAFGIVWDALTAGSWANTETRALPRVGRIFLYLGYVLLTVATINWALTTHNLFDAGLLTGKLAAVGLERFGRPLLYLVVVASLVTKQKPKAISLPDTRPIPA